MIATVYGWLRAHAHEHGATFIDYHAVLATDSGALRKAYTTDGLHLSPAGYRAIEPLMLEALGRVAAPAQGLTVAAPPRFGGRRGVAALAVTVLVIAGFALLLTFR